MAELDCLDFCLPSEFLAEDIFLEEKSGKNVGNGAGDGEGNLCFPSEFPYDWVYVSDVDSPMESVTGMESSDEGCIAGWTRQHRFLQEDEKVASSYLAMNESPKETRRVGSPQSTLSGAATWNASSREASDVFALLSSPPDTRLEKHKGDAGDQFYSAADKQQKQAGRGLLCPPAGKSFSPFTAGLTKNALAGHYSHSSLSQHKDVVAQIHQLKREQMAELQVAAAWRRHNRAKVGGGLAGNRPARPPGSARTSWTPPPQQAGSGMRAVFLGTGSRRETGGTGVFLPRRVGGLNEPRKKPALSTVLLPARVMQALNLNLDELGAQPRSPGGFTLQHDAIPDRNSAVMSQRRSYRPQPVHASNHQHEVCLPSEWTY